LDQLDPLNRYLRYIRIFADFDAFKHGLVKNIQSPAAHCELEVKIIKSAAKGDKARSGCRDSVSRRSR
jgi:hypothetical protein